MSTLKGRKILTVCSHGSNRSVTLAYMLKHYGAEAIPIGVHTASEATLEMLYNWADTIIVTDKDLVPLVKRQHILFNVGPDVYFRGFHPKLTEQFAAYIKAWVQ